MAGNLARRRATREEHLPNKADAAPPRLWSPARLCHRLLPWAAAPYPFRTSHRIGTGAFTTPDRLLRVAW